MIPITYFRSSSLSTYEQCPQKFFIDYILGHSGLSNKAMDKGTIIHKVMEILANLKKNQQEGKKTFTDKDIKMRVSNKTNVDKIIERVYKYYTEAFTHHDWTEQDFKDCKKWSYLCLENDKGIFDPRNLNIVDVEKRFDLEIPDNWTTLPIFM